MRITGRICLLAAVACTVSFGAWGAAIQGVVTDSEGKPVRGAVVRARAGIKAVSRFTQVDGRYQMAVAPGSYEVSASAFGFSVKRQTKDTTQPGDTNFSLSPKWDATRLSGAEIDRLVPDNADGKLLRSTCVECHDFAVVLHRTGQTADEWRGFLPTMTNGRRDQPAFSPAKLDALSAALGKYFGPDSVYFGPDAQPPTKEQVQRAALADAVLQATVVEWTAPSGGDSFPHSIAVDSQRGIAWFSEVGNRGLDAARCGLFTPSTPNPPDANCGDNHIGRFDIKTETFHEFAAPHPHTGAVGKDGRVWYAEGMRNKTSPNLAVIDPATNQINFFKDPDGPRLHTPMVDREGNVWLSGGAGEILHFDVETSQFKSYKFPVPAKFPENALGLWKVVPGDPGEGPAGTVYHIAEDSKGDIWASISDIGMIVRLKRNTGEVKEYFPPIHMSRGIAVDRHDNVWFSAYYDHKIGKLDPRTGTSKLYQPPTAGATPYGIIEDRKSGYIWYADQSGDNITQFDPKTEKFVEYPLPTRPSTPRFIDIDSDGKVWFTEYWVGRIGYLDTGAGSNQLASK
ncbi:MAG: carboxypeptidase regulatory-like domain-containing protein [Candidatus Acidiferrales bacterium]|jgi:streptogramin lyase